MGSSQFVKGLIGNVEKKIEKIAPYISKNEDWKFSVARVMLTGILKNQYYVSADDMAKEALPILISAAKKDPDYLLRAACFARDANMKGMVKVAIAALNGQADDKFLSGNMVRETVIGLLSTFHPGQLIQFVELCKSKACGRGLGARAQKWVGEAMRTWDADRMEDFTLKYPTALKALVRLVHPSLDEKPGKFVRYILDASKNSAKDNGKPFGKKQKAVEKLKKEASSLDIARTMLDENIPWDVIKGFAKMDKDVWTAAMTQMGLSALLLNIRSLEQHSVFDSKDGIKALQMKISEVKNGRSLPIDFAKPYIYAADKKVKNVLLDAMAEVLSVPMPYLEGREVGVSIDISGSMRGEPLQTAGLLAVPFVKAKNVWLTTFDDNLHEEGALNRLCPSIHDLSARQQIENLLAMRTNGCTNVSLAIIKATATKRKLDLMVIITDEQQNSGTPLMNAWNKYKQQVNPRAELWVINATNSPWHAADFEDPSVTVYQTMTPAIFKNLQFLGCDLVSAIQEYDLNKIRARSKN